MKTISGPTAPEQQTVHFCFKSGPSNGRRVSQEEIRKFREKTRRARKEGIYVSPEQLSRLKTVSGGSNPPSAHDMH